MRKLIAKGFVFEFVSLVTLAITITLAWIGKTRLQLEPEVIISASVGIAIASIIWALKWEIKREIEDKVGLFTLLEKIEDEELYARGKTAIENCRQELENLSKGVLNLNVDQLFSYMIQTTESAKKSVQVTQIVVDQGTIDRLQTVDKQPWYQHNVKLVKRGIKFERFFIIPRSIAINAGSGIIKDEFIRILEKQEQDKLHVLVIWQDELQTPDIVQDFAIVDNSIVVVAAPAWKGQYSNVVVYRKKVEIERYSAIFETLRSKGRTLSEIKAT